MIRKSSGYTLIEVLIALAILASALTILMGTMANSGQQAHFAADLTVASLLARSKMTDLEYEIMEEGFSTSDRSLRGNFSAEGYPDITWEALIEPIEIPPDAQEAFLGQVNAQLFGGADAQAGALQGNVAFSSMLPMLMAQLPQMINQIGDKVRRITLVVYFEFAGRQHPLEIMQYVADLETREFDMFGAPDDFGVEDLE
ncbi:MAG: type IV pilus modification PilV family protein [Bradymonadaceae bacterium]